MITRTILERADADAMLTAAIAEAARQHWAVCVAVVDEGGHLLAFGRSDGAPLFSIEVAQGKARAAALGCRPSKAFEDVIAGGRTAFLTAAAAQAAPFAALEGGEPLIVDGRCLGAIGVSGVQSDQDAQVARAGLAALPV